MADFAKVKDNKITQTYRSNKQYIDDNGVRFPPTIWQNTEFLKTQSLYKIQQGVIPNKIFYDIGEGVLSYDAKAKEVIQSYTSVAKTNENLKSHFHSININSFRVTLELTNYHIIRSQEDTDYKIPEEVSKWRAIINSEFDSNKTAIEKCGSISDFEKLNISFTQQPDDVI